MVDLSVSKSEAIKQKTLELYDSLPQDKALRMQQVAVRDQIFVLNQAFFGYIASKTFINNSSVTYEDKYQSACTHFMECWWWYKWQGDETHKGYRTDLSFSVFFKPRIGEMIERELNEVKYSIRRTLCMEVGAQLGKHWGQVKYEDLSDPRLKLSPEKMVTLQAIFGSLYEANWEDHEPFVPSVERTHKDISMSDNYNTVEELLIHEMLECESKLTTSKLKKMSEIYQIDYDILALKLPKAEKMLYKKLHKNLDNI